MAGASLLIILGFARFAPKVPGAIVVLFGSTAAVILFHLPVATIGSRFGGIPAGLPVAHIPAFQPALFWTLLGPATTVALLGAIESLLSAVVADGMTGGERHNSNTELFGQGIANIVSPIFGGLPATGAIARTATNIRSGAKTPVAGLVHSLTLLVVLLAAAPLAKNVPLAALAAILMVVAWNMGEWRELSKVFQQTYADIAVWAATFTLTVFADLTVAVQFGMILAALLFIGRIANTTTVSQVTHDYLKGGLKHILQDKDIPPYATILRIHGPFLFGSTDKLVEWEAKIPEFPPIVLLRLRNMTALDATGLHAIVEFASKLKASNRTMIVCGALPQPLQLMKRAKFRRVIGIENVCADIETALERAEAIYKSMPRDYSFDEG